MRGMKILLDASVHEFAKQQMKEEKRKREEEDRKREMQGLFTLQRINS